MRFPFELPDRSDYSRSTVAEFMKIILQLLAALIVTLAMSGCSTTGGSADSAPIISGYINTSASTHFNP